MGIIRFFRKDGISPLLFLGVPLTLPADFKEKKTLIFTWVKLNNREQAFLSGAYERYCHSNRM